MEDLNDKGIFNYEPKSRNGMIHTDHLATPQKMTDGTGTVVWSADYKPFGDTISISGSSVTTNLRFSGQYFDAETGLHYNDFRDYNPIIGRYIESDPIGILPDGARAGMNHLYVYVRSNPIKFIDPFGLKTYKCTKPLDALGGGTSRKSGPDVPGNPLYHEYLCVYNSSAAACGGQDRSGGPWSPGKPSQDVFNTQRCDEVAPDNKCLEDCLLNAFASPRPYYGLCGPGTNCQDWAESTLKTCQKKCDCKK